MARASFVASTVLACLPASAPLAFAGNGVPATVREQRVALRSGGCDQDAPVMAKLPAGTAIEVRSGVAGFSVPCYRVTAQLDGVEKIGYLPGPAIDGIEDFDRQRQQAASGDSIRVTSVVVEQIQQKAAAMAVSTNDPALIKAAKLMESNQPAEALTILEPLARQRGRDAQVQLMAGVASWKADNLKGALEYWRASLEIRPDQQLERLYQHLSRENANDRSSEKAYGVRVLLRYERESIDAAVAASIVRVLDGELSRVQETLGCPSRERLVAIVQSPENYHGSKSAPQWSGGQYDGRIRVPFAKGQPVDGRLRQVLGHETVHACLANLGQWPSWLHEGLAQKLSGEQPDAQVQDSIRTAAAELPGLDALAGGWTSMSASQARLAYTLAYMAADALTQTYPGASIQSVLREPTKLPQVTADLNRKLGIGKKAGQQQAAGPSAKSAW